MNPVLVARSGEIATVTLNNPGRLNALNKPMWAALGAAMQALSADDDLREGKRTLLVALGLERAQRRGLDRAANTLRSAASGRAASAFSFAPSVRKSV